MTAFNDRLGALSDAEGRKALAGLRRGLEREALRITSCCQLAMDPHPKALGSALTHSRITTDYSEALLEFITPVSGNIEDLLEGLTETHAYTLKHLDGQKLWPVSMPCYVGDVKDIPIAQYGSSNTGRMKTLYRKGLTYRYGALMQIISGVHFNFSLSSDLWPRLHVLSGSSLTLDEFISESYFGLIRNYRRLVWVLPYLFGASPAICGSFLKGQKTSLEFEKTAGGTLYLPYATSLRMSDLGYTNKEQASLNISYDSLHDYLQGIREAICLPSAKFAEIGVKVDGEYRQLNANVLQIENEFYAPIRAKRVTRKGEKPSEALARAGVEYIEVRALDVNPFSPVGVEASQLRFLDLFLLYCLLSDSPKSDAATEAEIATNLRAVIHEGRKPGLELSRQGEPVALKTWLLELFDEFDKLASLLDIDSSDYAEALAQWRLAVEDPALTLSGRVHTAVVEQGMNHGDFVMGLAAKYQDFFLSYPLSPGVEAGFQAEAASSLAAQAEIEASDEESFDEYLKGYFKGVPCALS
ncbi:glutamate--cysteine ligase [Shewanella zhangzhouensis]|uniref:glutamate--cysteine ligase n=1 Tax=Shewanella zhangzhouensis TaxID=2864213 RepID=UPI001C657D76|nr:glutamate--cysteine ligase [Shewanella zhangzhouensis]QYK06324.1 glutamate--cysteine ligase [Shewanella zhangzhouensis]